MTRPLHRAALAVLLVASCGPPAATATLQASAPPFRDAPDPTSTTSTTTTTTTSTTVPPRPTSTTRPSRSSSGRTVSSTAYCETGRMANGHLTADHPVGVLGNVAGNLWPLGTILEVSDGPAGAGAYLVADRIGSGSDLDFAIPGGCAAAIVWGRRTVTVETAR